jgi:3-deoxy-D-manno-octulosonate 8-phosphate phosphatase (KDO 8-P phosphatase)
MSSPKLHNLALPITCVICDLDGVLTDGCIYLSGDDQELRSYHVHDGTGLKLLMAVGIEVVIITGSRPEMVEPRMQQLQIQHVYTKIRDKTTVYSTIKSKLNIQDHNIAYIGDDVVDLPVMTQVGLKIAVANALPMVQAKADYITLKNGGAGAVREACEMILSAQGKLDLAIEKFIGV